MIAFRVHHNGTEVCTATVGPVGVLMAGVTWVRRVGEQARIPLNESEQVELTLKVNGLHASTHEHLVWDCPGLRLGDRVEIAIVETPGESAPDYRYEDDAKAIAEAQKREVRRVAALFGWTIIEDAEPRERSHPC